MGELEIWKDIKDYEGLYQVSNLGRVKSFHKKGIRILADVESNCGYLSIKLCKNGHIIRKSIHRLVLENFIQIDNNKRVCNHIDGNKKNNKLGNLQWTTQSQNIRHSIYVLGNNTAKIGSKNPSSKLLENDVLNIRRNKNDTIKIICEKYKISQRCYYKIINRETWKHI